MFKGKGPLIVAGILFLCGFGVSILAIQKERRDVRERWDPEKVVVASQEISEGTMLTEEMIAIGEIPQQFVTSSVVKKELRNTVINAKVLVPLQRGDPLLWSQIDTKGNSDRLSSKVQRTQRAITVEATSTNAVGGWVRPNDHVDIIGTFKDPQTNELVSRTVLENVIVLATGKITGTTNINLIPENERTYSHVSLMVVPEEAEILVLAQELGSLTLALRNPEDTDVLQERGRATMGTLLSGERAKVLLQLRTRQIEVIRGGTTAHERGDVHPE